MSHRKRVEQEKVKTQLPDTVTYCPGCKGTGVISSRRLFCGVCTGRGSVPAFRLTVTDRERFEAKEKKA